MNLCYMTQKWDAARLGPRWILRKGKFGLSASLNSVEAADPELFHTKREISNLPRTSTSACNRGEWTSADTGHVGHPGVLGLNVQVPKDLVECQPLPSWGWIQYFQVHVFSYNTKPKQKPTYSSGNAVHTIFAFCPYFSTWSFQGYKEVEEFPGSLVVETLCFHFHGPGSDTWSEN